MKGLEVVVNSDLLIFASYPSGELIFITKNAITFPDDKSFTKQGF